MALLPTNAETLLTGLSDFWQRFFADKDQLNVLYAATEELLGQAYLDLVTQVLNSNLDKVPLFNREFWHLLTIREDALSYVPGDDWPYKYALQDGLREFVFLLNRVYNPTASFELDVDFVIEGTTLAWKNDPFTQTDGIPVRQLDIVPSVYRIGRDGVVGAGPTSTFTILGNVQEGNNGGVTVVDRFSAPSAKFTAADIGRKIYHTNTADFTLAQEVRTITGVLDETTVFCSPDAAAVNGAGLQWAMRDEGHFNAFDVGRVIELTNPAIAGDVYTYTIASVVDDGAPTDTSLVVTFTEEIADVFNDTARIPWRHISQTRVSQAAYWVPDAFFDRENLYLSFGYLINRFEPSTESYRALIQGIFRYFMLGPSLGRIESALNVMVGVPVVREDGEVYQSLDIAPSGLHRVSTDRNSYEIPLNSLRSEIQVGDTLAAFQALTDIFEATDSVDDPTWFYGATIPEALLPGPDEPRRVADPRLYPLVCGADKWRCGDPHLYCGGDYTGFVETRQVGSDIYHTGDTTKLRFKETVYIPEDVGKTLVINDVEYVITGVATDPDPYVTVTDGTTDPYDLGAEFAAQTFNGVSASLGDVWDFASAAFKQEDVGRLVEVTASTTIPLGAYRIVDILSPTRIQVADYVTGDVVSAPADVGFQVRLGLFWDVQIRPPLRQSTGYLLFQYYLRTHIFQVTYDYGSYPDLSYPRPEEDIRDVLDAGKPAYTYMLVAPRAAFADTVGVSEVLDLYGLDSLSEEMKETDWRITAGGGSVAGEYYAYSNPVVAWMDSVRRDAFPSITEIPQADTVDKIVFSAALLGGSSPTLTVTVWAWTGMSWVPTGDVEVLDPAGANVFVFEPGGARIAISVTETGGATSAGIAVGYITSQPQTMILTSPALSSVTGTLPSGDNIFTDLNFYFNETDILRELIVMQGNSYYRYRIYELDGQHSVKVVDAYTGSIVFDYPDPGEHDWYIGRPTRTATNTVVAGVPADVVKTTPGNYIVPWPVHVTYND